MALLSIDFPGVVDAGRDSVVGVDSWECVMRLSVVGCVAVCSLVWGGGVVQAAPVVDVIPWPVPVFGGEKSLPDRAVDRTTVDGWRLHVRKSGEVVHVNPPLDSSVTTGEVFGSVNASVWIDGKGSPQIRTAVFDMGYQIGCGVDVSKGMDVSVAGTVGVAPHTSVGLEGGPSVSGGVQAGPSVSVSLPSPSVTGGADGGVSVDAGADATVKAETGVDSKAEVSPAVSMHLDPGKVTNVALVSRPVDVKYRRASAGFTGAHLQINGCAGPVTVRSYVQLSTTTATSVDQVAVYGDPQRIR